MKLFKMQLDRKQYHKVAVVLAAALILACFFGYNTYKEKKQYQTFLQNGYQRSFREMVTNVENIKLLLEKAEVSASPNQSSALMSQAWMESYSAAENLGQLPITHVSLSKTQKYLNQVGDYSYTLSRTGASNKNISEKDMEQISKLRTYAGDLLGELHKMEEDVTQGKIRFGEIRKKGRLVLKRASEDAVEVSFGNIEDKFNEYPSLIYDGPFSDNVIEGKPKGLDGEDINLEKAKEKAKKFIGEDKVGKIIETSSGKGKIHTFGLEASPKDNEKGNAINIDITKKGGYVLWMLNPRDIPEKKLTDQQASDKAQKFLKEQGFGELTETYFLKNDNTTTITFIGVTKEGVLIYPDLLKVKVALDNGEVVGFDAYQYLMSHRKRDIPKPKLTEEEARKKISQRIEVERVKLAIIPMPGNKEQLCYEFKGKYNKSDYFVYINADTGNEENILRIIKDKDGTLTQ
ncbi:MAG: germination protein YpeB [Clostridiaceae bacterium]|jgi:germination protein YpeB|nr:germination protein YpeB [Clostridiaceae bacterium]